MSSAPTEAVRAYCYERIPSLLIGPYRIIDSLERTLSSVEIANNQPNMVDYLDLLNVADTLQYREALRLLTHLPPKLILDTYGPETLAVVATTMQVRRPGEKYALALDRFHGIPDNTIDRVRQWSTRQQVFRGRDIASQYEMSRQLFSGVFGDFDLPEALHGAVSEPEHMSARRAGRFALTPAIVERIDYEGWRAGSFDEVAPGVDYRVWLDTPTGFMLTYKGLPQAVAGIAISGYSSEVMVYQLQGVKGYRTGLNDNPKIERISSGGLTALDWRKVMLGAVEHVARAMGIETIGIRAGDKNEWIHPRLGQETAHLTLAAAQAAYDQQAGRLGFVQGIDGDWRRPVPSEQ